MTQDAAAIAAIVKGLSEAQRADLLKVSDSGAGIEPFNYGIFDNLGLRSSGLSCMFLTPLGLAVRAHLRYYVANAPK